MATQLIDEEKMMIDMVRDLAREKVAPRAAEIDAQGEFPWDMKELLAEQDILGMPFPEEYGGLGSSELSILMVIEELAQRLRHDLAHPLRAAAWLAADPAGGNRRAKAALHPKARQWRVAGGVRADRARLRLRRWRDAHARREARRCATCSTA